MALLITATATASAAPAATSVPAWAQWLHLPGVVDLAGPRSDGRLVAAARGRLVVVSPSGGAKAFAPTYSVLAHAESYITLSPGLAVDGAQCRFARDEVLALDLRRKPPGITRISGAGKVSHLANVKGVSTLTGITVDTVGDFGHRVLVVGRAPRGKTRVSAVDCRGAVSTVATVGTALEGGIAVAPRGFGTYGGQLVAANEHNGRIYAVSPRGQLRTIATPSVPAGGDIGVEALGFVPATGPAFAYLADRGTPASSAPHPGTDTVLRLDAAALSGAGVRAGDLLAGTEGGATVVSVRCLAACVATKVATGPPPAHAEGHLVVT